MQGIRELRRLSGLVLEAELADLKKLSGELEEVTGAVARLAAARRDHFTKRHSDGRDGWTDDPALRLGRDLLWLDWQRVQAARLGLQQAAIAARREERLVTARHALGRVQVLDTVAERARQETARTRARRAGT